MRRFRFAFRPGWLVTHLLVVVLGVTMVLLGRWQLDVSNERHFDIQNFGYAIQWWLFTGFVLVLWARLMRDTARRAAGEPTGHEAEPAAAAEQPVAYRRYVMPTQPLQQEVDPMRSAYNDYLAGLAAADEQEDAR